MKYTAIFIKHKDSWHYSYPDINKLRGKGKTLEQAHSNARLALSQFIYTYIRNGWSLPPVTPHWQIAANTNGKAVEISVEN